MNITELPLSETKPYPNNPRKNKKGIAAVKRSIEAFGFTQPITQFAGQRTIARRAFYGSDHADCSTRSATIAERSEGIHPVAPRYCALGFHLPTVSKIANGRTYNNLHPSPDETFLFWLGWTLNRLILLTACP
ncbi:MAG: ParB N-terminal domain-containing protein [Planctomycetaceae bacterium]|nr:ParB N-terminal domain-containing protein [Planctomycetaceae bacterium]